jgi:hypothetical protein
MNHTFNNQDCEAFLLVDASNAFYSLNRLVALKNIRALFPSIATALINTYCELFVDASSIFSQEGTTQGDPWPCRCMPLPYSKVNPDRSMKELRYADNASAAGLQKWCNALVTHGPQFDCNINPLKTLLLTKDGHYQGYSSRHNLHTQQSKECNGA